MISKAALFSTLAFCAALAVAGTAYAGVPATVTVGDPNNTADTTGYGAVGYTYEIGKYEVTNQEYCDFLNGVAKSDTNELYDPRMDGGPEDWGGISRSGDYGSYTYSVRSGMEKKPVGYVTWQSALRYANWLTNGQGNGDTETGSYKLEYGEVTVPDHAALAAGKTAKWVLPTENEWYKAAYYDPKKSGGAGYWQFPGGSDDAPEANLNSNAATDVGTYVASPYGTYDQGGNVWEWNESQSDDKVGLRGGSFYINDREEYMRSSVRYDVLSAKWPHYGFRVARLGGEPKKAEEKK